jgi:hypothetical protein
MEVVIESVGWLNNPVVAAGEAIATSA